MRRFFIRVGDLDSNDPWVDDELLTEKEANAEIAAGRKGGLHELIPITTDTRQIKQEVIL